jgi:ADP-heptose:LPS heptosyltransferase
MRRAVVHPGSGGLAKCCSIESMEAIARRLRTLEWNVRWVIGPDEVERFGEPFRQRLHHSAEVLFREDVSDAAEAIGNADFYVGNDAGMTHVAAAAGLSTVALFGPTDSGIWKPLGSAVHVATFPTPTTPIEAWVDHILRLPGILT